MTGPAADNPDAQAAFGAPSERKRASTAGYWLAGLLALVASTAAVLWLVNGFSALDDRVDDLHRLSVPGQAVVELEAGKQSVYWEGGGESPAMQIAVRKVDGPEVEVGPHGGEVTYDVGGRSGTSVAGFEVEDAGRYRVVVRGDSGGTVAVGEGVGGQIVRAIVGAIVIFIGGLLLSGVLIIVTARRRRTERRSAA